MLDIIKEIKQINEEINDKEISIYVEEILSYDNLTIDNLIRLKDILLIEKEKILNLNK